MKQRLSLFLSLFLISLPFFISAQESQDFDEQREEEVKKWSKSGFGDVNEILKSVLETLENENASISALKVGATQANAAANFVMHLQEEYADYYRENYQYEFIQKKVAPAHDAYIQKANLLKDARNNCYMRIGHMLKGQGKNIEAFFYFRDAYRLSTFDTRGEGTRYKAEQEMKEMLGLQEINSYVTW